MKNGYAEFLRMFDWNYFITCRTHYKVHLMTARNWINKLVEAEEDVEETEPVEEKLNPISRFFKWMDK